MNKKGFTLAELMGVLVILGIVSTVVTIGISTSLNKSKIKTCLVQEKTIVDAAKMYFTDNSSTEPVSIKKLIDDGYLDKDIENPMTGSKYVDTTEVRKEGNKYTINYATNDKGCTS